MWRVVTVLVNAVLEQFKKGERQTCSWNDSTVLSKMKKTYEEAEFSQISKDANFGHAALEETRCVKEDFSQW